jgi:hypothetical protein
MSLAVRCSFQPYAVFHTHGSELVSKLLIVRHVNVESSHVIVLHTCYMLQ